MTSQNTITKDTMRDAMEAAGLEETVGTLSNTYSPRNNPGQTCMSFVISGSWGITRRVARLFAVLAAAQAYETADDNPSAMYAPVPAEELADVVTIDNLGRDTIVYFPGWKLAD